MTVIEKKIWQDMFENDQKEPVDFRLADFNLSEGDQIRFREWNPQTKQYTGREFTRTVGRVTRHSSPTRYWTPEELEQHGVYIIEWE
ncbi:DUF3850 domain-containing protein [Candidatus Woesearchaeota archaeon]|nr:DUF3850 domain-containing protein [Candidatus Woesearchaeota archaeon]